MAFVNQRRARRPLRHQIVVRTADYMIVGRRALPKSPRACFSWILILWKPVDVLKTKGILWCSKIKNFETYRLSWRDVVIGVALCLALDATCNVLGLRKRALIYIVSSDIVTYSKWALDAAVQWFCRKWYRCSRFSQNLFLFWLWQYFIVICYL